MMVEFYNVSYKVQNTWVLKNINFSIDRGDFYYIKGPNAVGKSTILKMIYMQKKPTEGTVIVGNYNSATIKRRQIPYLRRQLGIIFQEFWLLEDYTVMENIIFALRVQGIKGGDARKKALKAMFEMGIDHLQHKYPKELSGGDRQKVAITRAVANEPFLLLADEPTANLSAAAAEEIMHLLEQINRKGTAVLMATHDDDVVKSFIHKTIFIEGGSIYKIVDPFQKEPE